MTARISGAGALVMVGDRALARLSQVGAMMLVGAPTYVDTSAAQIAELSAMMLVGPVPSTRLLALGAMALVDVKSTLPAPLTGHLLQQQTY